jgi:hypothetical protein
LDKIETLLADIRRLRAPPAIEKKPPTPKEEIERKLAKKINLSCVNMPLSEIVKQLGAALDVPIEIDVFGFRYEGWEPNLKTTLEVRGASGQAALAALKRCEGLDWMIADEVLCITRIFLPERANQATRLWNVTDLVRAVDAEGRT